MILRSAGFSRERKAYGCASRTRPKRVAQTAMRVEPPCPENQDYFRSDGAPDECGDIRRRPAEAVTDIGHQEESYIRAESMRVLDHLPNPRIGQLASSPE